MLSAVGQHIRDMAKTVNASWLENPSLQAAILFLRGEKTPPVWAAVSCAFAKGDILIGKTQNATYFRRFKVKKMPTILMIDGSKRWTYSGPMVFVDVESAITRFFAGEITPTPVPTPRPVEWRARLLTEMETFDRECRGRGVYCVLQGAEEVSLELEELAQGYSKDRFGFFACGAQCPLAYARNGVWVFHPKREEVIFVDTLWGVSATLDRVLDGAATFTPLANFKENPTESDL
jgi:hypothetical protein